MRVRSFVVCVVAVSLCAVFVGCDSTKSAMDKLSKMIQELFEDEYVTMVKNGKLNNCPNYTVGTLVENYMGDPEWESGQSNNGNTYVNISGNITFLDKPARGVLQLLINDNGFSFHAFEINGEPQSDIIAMVLLNNMCEDAEKGSAKSGNAQQSNTDSAQSDAPAQQKSTEAAPIGSRDSRLVNKKGEAWRKDYCGSSGFCTSDGIIFDVNGNFANIESEPFGESKEDNFNWSTKETGTWYTNGNETITFSGNGHTITIPYTIENGSYGAEVIQFGNPNDDELHYLGEMYRTFYRKDKL